MFESNFGKEEYLSVKWVFSKFNTIQIFRSYSLNFKRKRRLRNELRQKDPPGSLTLLRRIKTATFIIPRFEHA